MNFKIILLSIFLIATTIISEDTSTEEGKGENFSEQPVSAENPEPDGPAPMMNCNIIFKDSADAIKIIKLLRGGKGGLKLDYKAELRSDNDTAFKNKSIALEISSKILFLASIISLVTFVIN